MLDANGNCSLLSQCFLERCLSSSPEKEIQAIRQDTSVVLQGIKGIYLTNKPQQYALCYMPCAVCIVIREKLSIGLTI